MTHLSITSSTMLGALAAILADRKNVDRLELDIGSPHSMTYKIGYTGVGRSSDSETPGADYENCAVERGTISFQEDGVLISNWRSLHFTDGNLAAMDAEFDRA